MSAEPEHPMVAIRTSKGTITAELWREAAPKTVENFLTYIDDGFFDGLIFHRVIGGFMIQGGGMDEQMQPRSTRPAIENEASADVPNERGTLAMARTSEPDSATSQFFINLVDNDFLNHKAPTPQGCGYCVFGKVTDRMDVVDAIAEADTTTRGGHKDVPVEPVVIETIERV